VRNPNRGADFVYVLTAGSAGAVKIHSQIILINFDIDILIEFRDAVHSCKARMPPLIGIEWTYPNKPMHTRLAREFAERERPGDPKRYRPNASLFTRRNIELLKAAFFPLKVPRVHSEKHTDPVTTFGAAGAGVNTKKAVSRVVWAAEQPLQLNLFASFYKLSQVLLQMPQYLVIRFGNSQIEELREVVGALLNLLRRLNQRFKLA
jgi:hypothetical protein